MSSYWLLLVSISVVALMALVLLIVVPQRVQRRLRHAGASEAETISSARESRRLIVEGAGGFALIVGLLLTLYQLQVSQRTLEGTERAQIESRFNAALAQLGESSIASQIAGVYSLESVARSEPNYLAAIDQTLAAYVRSRSNCAPGVENCAVRVTADNQPPDPAMQAALTVLGRVPSRSWVLDLRGSNLSGIDLSDGNFEGANLVDCDFSYSTIAGTRLQGANLRGALTLYTAKDYSLAKFDSNTKNP